jgi:hypothetical protein
MKGSRCVSGNAQTTALGCPFQTTELPQLADTGSIPFLGQCPDRRNYLLGHDASCRALHVIFAILAAEENPDVRS